MRDTLFNGVEFYKLGLGSTATIGVAGPQLYAAGFAATTGSIQRLVGPPGMFDVAREYCLRVQYLMLSDFFRQCGSCPLQVGCFAYTDLTAFQQAAPRVQKVGSGFHVTAHVYIHRNAFQENVCGALAAP